MDLLNLILEKHNKLLADGKLLSIEKLNESYRTFQENFGPDTLKSLDGEVLLKPFSITAVKAVLFTGWNLRMMTSWRQTASVVLVVDLRINLAYIKGKKTVDGYR